MKLMQSSQILVFTIYFFNCFLNESRCAPIPKGITDAYTVTLQNASYIPGIFTTGLLVIPFTPAQQVLVNSSIISNTSVISGYINPIQTPNTVTTSPTHVNLAGITNPITISPSITTGTNPDTSTSNILPTAGTKPTPQLNNQALPSDVVDNQTTMPTSQDTQEETVLAPISDTKPNTESDLDNTPESITEEDQEGGISENDNNTELIHPPMFDSTQDGNTASTPGNNPNNAITGNGNSLSPLDKQAEGMSKVADNNPVEDKTMEHETVPDDTTSEFPIEQEQTKPNLQNTESHKPEVTSEPISASTSDNFVGENTVLTPENNPTYQTSASTPSDVSPVIAGNNINKNTTPISPDSQKEKTTLATQQKSPEDTTIPSKDKTLISVPNKKLASSPDKVTTPSETTLVADSLPDVTSLTTDNYSNKNSPILSPYLTEQNIPDGKTSLPEDKILVTDEAQENMPSSSSEQVIDVTSSSQSNPISDSETTIIDNSFIQNENTGGIIDYNPQDTESESQASDFGSLPAYSASSFPQTGGMISHTTEDNKPLNTNTENYISPATDENYIAGPQINTEDRLAENNSEYLTGDNNNVFQTTEQQATPLENIDSDATNQFDNGSTNELGTEDSSIYLNGAGPSGSFDTTNSATSMEGMQNSGINQHNYPPVVQSNMKPTYGNTVTNPAELYGSYSDGTSKVEDQGNTNNFNSNSWESTNSNPEENSWNTNSHNSGTINQYKPTNTGGQGYINGAMQYGSNYPSNYGGNTYSYTPYKYHQGMNGNTPITYSPSYSGTMTSPIGSQTMYKPSYSSGSINPSYGSSPAYSYSQSNYPSKTSFVVAPMKTGYHQMPLVPAKIYKPTKTLIAIPATAKATSPVAAVPVSTGLVSQSHY